MPRALSVLISTFIVLASVSSARAQSATQQLIYSFCQQSGCADGGRPTSGMTLLSDGSFVVASGSITTSQYNVGGAVLTFTPTGEGKGVASLAAPSKGYPAGSYPIKAAYSGDAADNSYSSTAVNVTVK